MSSSATNSRAYNSRILVWYIGKYIGYFHLGLKGSYFKFHRPYHWRLLSFQFCGEPCIFSWCQGRPRNLSSNRRGDNCPKYLLETTTIYRIVLAATRTASIFYGKQNYNLTDQMRPNPSKKSCALIFWRNSRSQIRWRRGYSGRRPKNGIDRKYMGLMWKERIMQLLIQRSLKDHYPAMSDLISPSMLKHDKNGVCFVSAFGPPDSSCTAST